MSLRLIITNDDGEILERIHVVCLDDEDVPAARRIVDLVYDRYDCYEERMSPDSTPRIGP